MEDFTVADIVREYLEDAELRGARTLSKLRYLGARIVAFCGDEPAADITTSRLHDYQIQMRREGYAPGTVNMRVRNFRAVLRLAEMNGRIARAPMSPRRLSGERPREGFFSREDFTTISAALPEWARDVFAFAFWTGARKRETLDLAWNEVHLDEGVIRLPGSRTKTGAPRIIPLGGEIRPLIERRAAVRVDAPPLVFYRRVRGGHLRRISEPMLNRVFRRACEKAGKPGGLWHDARRSCARALVLSGVRERVAMAYTGHATRDMFDRYQVVDPAELREASEKLAAFGKNGLTRPECKRINGNQAMQDIAQEFAPMTPEELRGHLVRLGLYQHELAQRIGVKQPTIARWVSGSNRIPNWATRAIRELKPEPYGARK